MSPVARGGCRPAARWNGADCRGGEDRRRAWPRRSAAEWAAAQECKPIDRRRGDVRSENNIPSPSARGGAPLPHAKPPRASLRPPHGADAPSLGSGTPLPKPFLRHTLTSAVRTICNCGARTARLDGLRLRRKPILSRRMAFAPRSRDAPKLFWGALRVTARKVAAKPPSHS